MQDLIELLSLGFTVPTIVLSLNVVRIFGRRAIDSLKCKRWGVIDLFILGITVGFVGSTLDNLYWGAAWTADYLDWEIKETLFQWGAWSNIPNRQITTTLAAFLHCLVDKGDVDLVRRNDIHLKTVIWFSFALMILVMAILYLLKTWG